MKTDVHINGYLYSFKLVTVIVSTCYYVNVLVITGTYVGGPNTSSSLANNIHDTCVHVHKKEFIPNDIHVYT